MNVQKLTQKSIEAIQGAQNLAMDRRNSQVEQEHLMLALLQQEGGLIGSLMEKMGVQVRPFEQALEANIRKLPQLSQAGQLYASADLENALNEAEKQAAAMQDEYTSVEHLMLGILEKPSAGMKQLLTSYQVNEKIFREVLKQTR